MVNCVKCSAEIPINGAMFCPFCGATQTQEPEQTKERTRTPKARGNGQGTAFKRGNTWTASVTVGWKLPEDPSKPKIPVKRTKGGFRTKKEAIAYCPQLMLTGNNVKHMTLEETYLKWKELYEPRIVKSTMVCYVSAYKHFKPLHGLDMRMITSDDLQKCMDECPSGHRTHQNMKCVAGLIWGYAFDQNIVDKDITDNLYIGKGQSVQRDPITEKEVAAIKECIGKVRYADYIYSLCWLGFRPGEMLELKKEMLFSTVIEDEDTKEEKTVWYFVNGKKTDAGKDRIVVIPDQILDIVLARKDVEGTDLLFPQYKYSKKTPPEFNGYKQMSHEYFNKHCFKPLMKSLGFDGNKVPYCARHTYADKLKDADGTDKDKAALIGHSKYLFTQKKYQSSDIPDLVAVVDSMK